MAVVLCASLKMAQMFVRRELPGVSTLSLAVEDAADDRFFDVAVRADRPVVRAGMLYRVGIFYFVGTGYIGSMFGEVWPR